MHGEAVKGDRDLFLLAGRNECRLRWRRIETRMDAPHQCRKIRVGRFCYRVGIYDGLHASKVGVVLGWKLYGFVQPFNAGQNGAVDRFGVVLQHRQAEMRSIADAPQIDLVRS